MAASIAGGLSSAQLADGAADELPVEVGATLSLLPVAVGFVLAAVTEVFRRGALLRDDVEGLV